MKPSTLLSASIIAFAFARFISAQTVIHITGSPTMRVAANQAIVAILQPGTVKYGYTGPNLSSAAQAIFSGKTTSGSIPVIIKTSWSGTVSGIMVLAKNDPVPDSAIGLTGGWLANSTPQSASGTPNANASNIDPATTADVTFSDSFQSATLYPTPALTGANQYTQGIVAVIPFEWVLGNTSGFSEHPLTITNITDQQIRDMLAGGDYLSYFDEVASDALYFVFVLGRDSDSGIRLEAFAESGYGILHTPTQYQVTISRGTITSIDPWPAQTTDGISYPLGHEGYSNGSDLATALNTSGGLTAGDNSGLMIGYMSVADAQSVTNGALLSYNGVPYSLAAVEYGLYSLWGYEHIYYLNNNPSPAVSEVVFLLAEGLYNNANQYSTEWTIPLIDMRAKRNGDGGVIYGTGDTTPPPQ